MSRVNNAKFTDSPVEWVKENPVKWVKENPVKAIGVWTSTILVAWALASCDPKSEQAPNTTTDTTVTNPYICQVQEGTATWTGAILVWDPLDPNSIAFTTDPNDRSIIWGSNIPYRLPNILNTEDNSLSIHFLFDRFALDEWDKDDLRTFAEQINTTVSGQMTLVIEWNADSRGTEDRNNTLSLRRANQVRDFISPLLNEWIEIRVASFWSFYAEPLPFDTHEERLAHREFRSVTLIPTENMISRALERFPADIYLLDASWSMSWNSWNAVMNHEYWENSQIFTFTTGNELGCAEDLGTQRVTGSTPLYQSLLELVSNSENAGRSITLLSDGADTEGGNIDEIIRLAQENNIQVNTIGINVAEDMYDGVELARIADATEWDKYFEEQQ